MGCADAVKQQRQVAGGEESRHDQGGWSWRVKRRDITGHRILVDTIQGEKNAHKFEERSRKHTKRA